MITPIKQDAHVRTWVDRVNKQFLGTTMDITVSTQMREVVRLIEMEESITTMFMSLPTNKDFETVLREAMDRTAARYILLRWITEIKKLYANSRDSRYKPQSIPKCTSAVDYDAVSMSVSIEPSDR